MKDPVRSVILDANVLAAHFCPCSTDSAQLRDRSRALVTAGADPNWPSLRLYTPGICIAEVLAVLDRYNLCTWHGPLKRDPTKKLTLREYRDARQHLVETVRSRAIEQLEHEPTHVLLAGMVSPVNNAYQFRRNRTSGSSQVKPPMSAADCVIAAMAILQGARVGQENVVLATADQRLADVMVKCRSLRKRRAGQLGLDLAAKSAGLTWNPRLYPYTVNLRTAKTAELRRAFLGWPLPQGPFRARTPTQLSSAECRGLERAWREVSRDYSVRDPDRLPYGDAIDDLRTRFAADTGISLSNGQVFATLLRWRKAKAWPSGHTGARATRQEAPLLQRETRRGE